MNKPLNYENGPGMLPLLPAEIKGVRGSVGIVMGNPWVSQTNPYPYPWKPIPMTMGMGFHGYGYGFLRVTWVRKPVRVQV
jgi:hypothetical protein